MWSSSLRCASRRNALDRTAASAFQGSRVRREESKNAPRLPLDKHAAQKQKQNRKRAHVLLEHIRILSSIKLELVTRCKGPPSAVWRPAPGPRSGDLNARPRDAALDGTWGQPARVSEPSSAATKSFNLSRLAPLFLMHTLFSSVQRRHNHPNPSQDVSGESHRLYHHARSPSRPNLEAPNLPSSVLSPQVHDRSPPSVVPVPSSASPPGARDLPVLSFRITVHRHLSCFACPRGLPQLLIRLRLRSRSPASSSLSFQRAPSVPRRRHPHRKSSPEKTTAHPRTHTTRRLPPTPQMVISP
ncbi:hypothetical protein ACJZ2D_007041 [Fusarium nematophilum]